MKKDLERTIEIPEGIEVSIEKATDDIVVKGNSKEIRRNFNLYNIKIVIEKNLLKITSKGATKKESKMLGTIWAHIKNMIQGINEDFVYKLEIASVHFPMSVKVDEANKKVVIKSFLGETTERIANISENVKVDIQGSDITVSSYEKEAAGQTAANIEKAARLTGRDRRIFQDGIYITEKCGRKI